MPAQNRPFNIVVVGATGNVGRKIVDLILQRKLTSPEKLILLASQKSAGSKLNIHGIDLVIQAADTFDFSASNVYLFATESDISKKLIERITSPQAIVIDSSSLLRMQPDVPLIVAPVNSKLISAKETKRYAIANCIASPASIVLAPLHDTYTIKSAHINTYQSVSGAGKDAMDELYMESKHITDGTIYQRKIFPRQIAFNVIPQIDTIMENGYTKEELKIMQEIQKILSVSFPVCATSVRVPVYIGHSSVIAIECEKPFDLGEVRKLLAHSTGIKISDRDYTTPTETAGSDDVFVGRIRRDPTTVNGLIFWICSDNLRRGAAVDAVEVATEIIDQLKKA